MEALAPTLSRFVEAVRVVEPTRELELLPDGRTSIIYRVTREGADISASGPRTKAKLKSTGDLVRAVVLRFKPGWSASLLGVGGTALTDTVVLLRDLWGSFADELRDELLAARTPSEVIARIDRALETRALVCEPASARLARRAARLLEAEGLRIDDVAERLGVTARHLRRAFTESVGIGPKHFARAVRLQRAVRMTSTSTDWSRIATAAGYYDQAHLIAEFRQLVGVTPGAYVKHGLRSPGQ